MVHGIIWWIVVGLIAGWAAGKIMKGGGYGVIADIALGIVGAVIGGWVVGLVGFGGGGSLWTILVAILGAVILIWITRLVKKEVRRLARSPALAKADPKVPPLRAQSARRGGLLRAP